MIETRLRTKIPDEELQQKVGKILTDRDYNLLLTGAARVLKPNGQPLCVYLPGAVKDEMDLAYYSLQRIKVLTDNRGLASGTKRMKAGGNRTRAGKVHSAIVGAMDGPPREPECRLTSYTRQHMDRWQSIFPLLVAVNAAFRAYVPDRYKAQVDVAQHTHEDWVVPGTCFSTVTVNNTYPTGVHTDKGDLDAGFSTLAVGRRGNWTGGKLVFPEYRVAVDMQDGDLLLMDAHEWHGNTMLMCQDAAAHGFPGDAPEPRSKDLRSKWDRQLRRGPCACGSERISVVSYFRTKVAECDSQQGEEAKRVERLERRAAAQA